MLAPAHDSHLLPNHEYRLRQKLSDSGRLLGPTASATLSCLEELGDFLHSKGRYNSAEGTFRRLVRMWKREQGSEDEHMARALQKLGDTLFCQGRASAAEKLVVKACAISKRLTGEESELTLGCLGSLASIKHALGRYEDARSIRLEAVGTSRSVLGEQHIETLQHLVGLADACRSSGRFDEAESIYHQLLNLDQGAGFPLVQARSGLGNIHSLRGRFTDAIQCHEKALEKIEQRGPYHPSTLGRQDDLAAVYCISGRLGDAERLCEEVFEKKRQLLGEGHPETILNRLLMANIRRHQRRLHEAEVICKQSFEQLERIFGAEHPRTVASMLLLVDIWQGQGQRMRALECFEKCVELRKILLPEHPNTLMMIERLDEWKSRATGDER